MHAPFSGAAFAACLLASQVIAQPATGDDTNMLSTAVPAAVTVALQKFAAQNFQSNQVAVTAIDITDPDRPLAGHYRGDVPIYPASVIKLFYLVAAHQWMESGRIADSSELRRAMRDMIVESYNEATHYVLDLVTGTTGGPELPDEEMQAWTEKRNAVNRYFTSLGYTKINANQKPWCEGPYGRERVFVGKTFDNRNMLTTEATALLLADVANLRAVSPNRSKEMLALLARDPSKKEDSQGSSYTGLALPPGARLWSKAGWTSQTRHDAAYVELATGGRFVVVVFTVGQANNREIIPAIVQELLPALRHARVDRPQP